MKSFCLKDSDKDVKRVAFTIDKEVRDKLKKTLMYSEHYNLKQKSIWIIEAIDMLTVDNDYLNMVYRAEGVSESSVVDKIYMSFDQRCSFANIRNEVVKKYPDIRGPQASIIRAAIMHRLIQSQ